MTIDSDTQRFSRALRSAIFWPVGVIFLNALLLLALVLWLFHSINWSDHSYEVTSQSHLCEKQAIQTQNDVRGYLLTGDPTFLDIFTKSLPEVDGDFERLKQLVADNPAQETAADDLIRAKNNWYQYGKLMIERRQQSPRIAPEWVMMGKTLMDTLDSQFDAFNQTERLLQEHRLKNVQQAKQLLYYVGGTLLILLSLTVSELVRRQFIKLAQAYRTALDSIEQRHAALVRSEADLEEQKEWFRVTLSSIGDGVIVTDREGRIVFMNHEAERLTDWTSVEALLQPLSTVFRIINEQTRISVENPVARVFQENKVIGLANHTVLLSRVGQEWPIEDSAAPIRDARGNILGVVMVFHDATELRQSQNTLKSYSVDLEKKVAERTATLQLAMAELETFSYTVSHDLRSPLRAMQGFAEAVQEDYADRLDEQGKNYLERIKNAANRLDRLIQDLLSYTRISRHETSLVALDIDQLIHDLIEHYPNLHSPAADVTVEGTLPQVMGQEALLTQVLSNLLGNAAKFVPPGTHPRIRVWGEDRGSRLRIWIQDNGIGIAPEDRAKIFQMFVQLNDSHLYDGTGVGLAIVKKAVETMRGSVGVESEAGRGSNFWVELTKASS